ncbi:electron transport complex subunit RsxC [Zooshikella ganghwensis]|uniref:Ion-translocating oxidoreductase complex subunit C n=1 Tax=Zooshikella ganghwensis TaxID=202772 RepID=A0A4P9VRK3_9GAMM|nr:electron transport complex subunit RsxC [Zooshikella ganghwensis]RDH45044.1 electron transport complex subunit RsxC [Zooshikella ganghwensis]
MTRKTWPLTGGIHPPENKHQSTQLPIKIAALPGKVVLPLSQHIGAPAEPIVAVGDYVLTGQCIARANGFVSAPVHASVSGTVTNIGPMAVPHASGMFEPCIEIQSDGLDQWVALKTNEDFASSSTEALLETIQQAGITGLGGAGFPTAVKLAARAESAIKTLIINGTECEPYITADDMLMRERADQIISGIQILQHLVKPTECLLGVEDNKPEAIVALKKAAKNTTIEIVVFPTKYPSGGEKQLIQILTGKEVPSGSLPADIGILCQNVGTAAAIHDAVILGKPLISRITTVTGEALQQPGNFEVRLGTPVDFLLEQASLHSEHLERLVMGGPMMGFTLQSLAVPIIKTTNCLIAATQTELPPASPAQSCIRCGHCAEACPVSLLPQQLFWFAQGKEYAQLQHHNLFDCIECGACAYVCPSHIPLVQYYRGAKGIIRQQELMQQKAAQSKQRFEARQDRLAKETAAKEAKRKANAEKAARLKAAAAEKAATDQQPKQEIQAALERAKAKKAPNKSKPQLTAEQKELKIQLAMVSAQLKKLQRNIEQSESTPDVKQQEDLDRLQQQQQSLETALAAATPNDSNQAAPPVEKATTSNSKENASSGPDLKVLQIKLAQAKAALKKAERAYAAAAENNAADKDALQATIAEKQAALAEAEQALAKAKTSTEAPSPSKEAASKKPKKPPLDEKTKTLKIQVAMAKAQLWKLNKLAEHADTAPPKEEIEAAEKALSEAESALAEHQQQPSSSLADA